MLLKHIRKATAKELQKYTDSAIKMAKQYQSDVFGYGSLIHKSNPKYWAKVEKNWNSNEFLDLEVNVQIKITLENKGSLEQTIKEGIHE